MIEQGFHIGNRDWWIMIFYEVGSRADLRRAYQTLLAAGCEDWRAQRACMVLSQPNKGYTYTNFADRITVVFISRATSGEQMYDSLAHEKKHIVEHIGEYFGIDPQSEESAYIQGEVARKMFPAAAMVICPHCHHLTE